MPKSFSEAIIEIMPLVKQGSDLPFVISHEDGNWNINYFSLNPTATPEQIKTGAAEYLSFLREKDHCAVVHNGAEFAGGSYAYVYDKILYSRLHEEYNLARSSGLDTDELHAMTCFAQDHIGEFSPKATDYLTTLDRPLAALVEMCPYGMTTDNPDWSYDEDLAFDAIHFIENEVNDRLHSYQDKSLPEPRYIDGYEEKQNITIDNITFVLAENINFDSPYLVCNIESNGEAYNQSAFPSYITAMREFLTRQMILTDTLEAERADRAAHGVDGTMLTDEHCLPDSDKTDFTGKLLIVNASELSPQYRYSDSQLVQCTHGNGARPNAKGRSVFGTELYSGTSVAYDRSSILGVADENKLPQWAKVKLEIQRDPVVFEFGGYHFKPYRQFHKGEVERHPKGDSRPWKMDAAYAMRNMSSDRSLGISTYDWGKADYSHEKFYAAANSEADIFVCLENGKLYVPNENELYRYNEPPQKEQAKTQETKYKECASAIDKDVSAVRYDEMPGGSARYDLKIALDRLNYQHGAETVNAVLAAVVIFNDNDGRYSRENRQWAASVPNPPVDVVRRCTIHTHPAVLNGLVDKARESTSKTREKRPDLLGKINENKQKVEQNKANADTPAKKKNRDGQEV